MRKIVIALVFDLGWFGCVTSGARNLPLAALAIATGVVACNLLIQHERLTVSIPLLVSVTLLGIGIETFHLWIGVFTLIGEPQFPWLCPLWMALLWTMFATLLRGPLVWLSRRYVLSALLGAAFAAPNYIVGARLGAVTLPDNMLFSIAVLVTSWAITMPLMVWLASAFAPVRKTP